MLNLFPYSISTVDLDNITIKQLQLALAEGKVTSYQLVLYYLSRIATLDQEGPMTNAILEINPDAIFIAEALDLERKERGSRGLLHGIPILIKGNIETADKMHTSGGALALEHHFAQEDAFLVQQLREAGAIILGKTNLTELANSVSYTMLNGYSSLGGIVKNPYGEFRVGGSSSGSGAAIAMNFAVGAIGTETTGSILDPSIQNSVVGLKPTTGLISRTGIIPFSFQQDTAGPMAKRVMDVAVILEALTKTDQEDPATWRIPEKLKSIKYSECLEDFLLHDVKIGVYTSVFPDSENKYEDKLFDYALSLLENAGAKLIYDIEIPTFHQDWQWNKLNAEAKHGFDIYLNKYTQLNHLNHLGQLIEWNNAHATEALPHGQQGLIDKQQYKKPLSNSHYIKELVTDLIDAQQNGIDYALEKYDVDVILFPLDFGSDVSARAGYPTLALPAGYQEDGEPYGITITGTKFSELRLLQIGHAFEKLAQFRKKPKAYIES